MRHCILYNRWFHTVNNFSAKERLNCKMDSHCVNVLNRYCCSKQRTFSWLSSIISMLIKRNISSLGNNANRLKDRTFSIMIVPNLYTSLERSSSTLVRQHQSSHSITVNTRKEDKGSDNSIGNRKFFFKRRYVKKN